MSDTRMANIANNGDRQVFKRVLVLENGEHIKQRLGWVSVDTVTSVNNGNTIYTACNTMRQACRIVLQAV